MLIDKLIRNQFPKRILVLQVFLLHLPDTLSLILFHEFFLDISIDAHTRGQALVLCVKALVTGYSRRSATLLRSNVNLYGLEFQNITTKKLQMQILSYIKTLLNLYGLFQALGKPW